MAYIDAGKRRKKMFKTEAHIHTSEVSKCGQVAAADMASAYAEAGYDTIFITDHINVVMRSWVDMTWEEKMEKHMSGYEAAREAGEKLGLRVLYGAEIAFATGEGHSNDYLVYGIDRDFLIGLERYYGGRIEDFYPYAKKHGALVIQAHPFRDGFCTPKADFVDGLEVCNAHPRHNNNNDKALALAKERGLLMTAGSDAHQYEDVAGAAVLSEKRIETVEDYIELIRSGKGILVGREGRVE